MVGFLPKANKMRKEIYCKKFLSAKNHTSIKPMLWIFVICIVLFPNVVQADPFGPRFVGGLDPGIPGHAAVTSIPINPAVMGLLPNNSLAVHFSPLYQNLSVKRTPISSVTGIPDPNGDLRFPKVNFSQNMMDFFVGFSTNFGMDRITLGLAFFSPQRQDLHVKHPALRYHLVDRSITHLFFIPSLSVRLHRKFYAGFGLGYTFSSFEMTLVRDRYLRGDLPELLPTRHENGGIGDETIKFNGTDNNFGFQFGFFWKLEKYLFLAGSYRSKIRALDYTAVKAQGKGSITQADSNGEWKTYTGNAKIVSSFPDAAAIGLSYHWMHDWWVDATLTWTRFSAHKNWKYYLAGGDLAMTNFTNWDLNITEYRGFQDTWSPQATLFYRPQTGFEAIFSLRYSPPAVPEKWVNPSTVDHHALEGLMSFSYQITNSIVARLGYALEYMIPLKIEKSGYDPSQAIACLESHIDVVWSESCRTTYSGRALPSAAGEYRKVTHQIGLGVEIKF